MVSPYIPYVFPAKEDTPLALSNDKQQNSEKHFEERQLSRCPMQLCYIIKRQIKHSHSMILNKHT